MKQILLLSLLITTFFAFGANDAPITVDDTIYFTYAQVHEFDSLRIMPTFLANDTDPNGQSIKLHDIIYSGANSFVPFSPTNQVLWITYKTSPNFDGIETLYT